jgi:hypothetical protein
VQAIADLQGQVQQLQGQAHQFLVERCDHLQQILDLQVSHPILQGKPNASHMCARINLHTHDRQKCVIPLQ